MYFVKEVYFIGLVSRIDQSRLACSPDGIALLDMSKLATWSDWKTQKAILTHTVSALEIKTLPFDGRGVAGDICTKPYVN